MSRTAIVCADSVQAPRMRTRFLCWFVFGSAILASLGSLSAQTDITPANQSQQEEFFEKRVRPLLVQHCYECHSDADRSGGLRLDSRQAWQRGGDTGPALVPGDAENSLLIQAVEYHNADLQMPPSGRLTDADVLILKQWIDEGAYDPREATDARPLPSTALSVEEGRSFWSFQPLQDPSPPALPDHLSTWVVNPIDRFVARRLLDAGLKPAPPADRLALIRRVTFDLTGLPPTPAEVDAFLADTSPEAYARVVERLLKSPRYGERWGRHWLDVARYADSNGLDENLAFGNAWRYRDYVIRAWNDDKPFDEFLVEQLAGDLLPRANEETLTATGFLALGAKVLAEPDREKLIMDTIDEQIDTTGKAFLGLTLGCCRCHDHKFDPVLQRDYYALAAIFKSTRTFADSNTGAIKHWYEHSFATPEELEQLKTVDAEIAAANAKAAKFKNEAMARLRSTAVGQAADYLAAATRLSPQDSLLTVEAVAAPLALHPRILHHLRLHLEYNRDDPLVVEWYRLQALDGIEDPAQAVREHFTLLFKESATGDAMPTEPPTSVEPADRSTAGSPYQTSDWEALRTLAQQALQDKAGLICVPPQPEFAFAPDTLEDYYRLLDEARLLESSAPDASAAMGVADGQLADRIPIHIRGSHRNLGPDVSRGFPEVLSPVGSQPIFPDDQSGRLELANWLAHGSHPLTARVFVNRLWGWHFGQALVRTTENFGLLGDQPSHPELLDWLARQCIRSGWSPKAMHRLILLSNTYRMAAHHEDLPQAAQVDPENELLWQFPRQRLDAEQLRDTLLFLSGRLDERMYGKSVPLRNRQFVFNHTSVDHTKYDSLRRAIYLPIIRNNLYPFFAQFDFPDPTMPTGQRTETTVAPQALLMMNDTLVMDCAEALAQRILADHSQDIIRIHNAYQLVLGRPANEAEQQRVQTFLADFENGADALDELARWTLVCQSLFACNEFMYLP